ncbi:MAG: hypothetical protein QGH60_21495 [Phycisphaerae bacterium]|jgi:hypothetical protein|nr:hypothetical protein [Phycisphaerae bacterium]
MKKSKGIPGDLRLVRRLSGAGLRVCRDALREAGDDVYQAIRSLISADQILEARSSLLVRKIAASSIKDPPTKQEIQIIERLYAELMEEREKESRRASAQADGQCLVAEPLLLPAGISSYKELVNSVKIKGQKAQDHESLVSICMEMGFNHQDAEYILDRIGAGQFRAIAERNGATNIAPDKQADPIAFAAYQASPHHRRWWKFW